MATTTTTYGYTKPDFGDTGWNTPLNNNWDLLDADLSAEHKSTGAHGPKVTISQTGNDNVLTVAQTTAATADVITITNSGSGIGLSITQAGSAVGAFINKTNTDGGNCLSIDNAGTGDGLEINPGTGVAIDINATSASSSSTVIDIINSGTGTGLSITQVGSATGVLIDKTNTDGGNCLTILNSGTGRGITISQVGNENAMLIVQSGTATAFEITVADDTSRGLRINKTGTGGNPTVEIISSSSGNYIDTDAGGVSGSTGARLTNAGVWTNASSVALKENFVTPDKQTILHKIILLPVDEWNYISDARKNITVTEWDPAAKVGISTERTPRHCSPTAEVFYETFGVGEHTGTLSAMDVAGIALVAIKALKEEIDSLKTKLNK